MISGKQKTRLRFFPIIMGLVTLAAIVIGILYGVGVSYSPFVIVNMALPFGVTVFLGFTVAKMAITNVFPSRFFLCSVSFIAGLIALYASWSTTAVVKVPGTSSIKAANPLFLAAYAKVLYRTSSVEIIDDKHTTEMEGPTLVALWIVEAAILTVGSTVVSLKFFQQLAPPLCQKCQVWQSEKHGILRCGLPEDLETFKSDLLRGDLSLVEALPASSIDDDPHIRIDVGWCSSCNENCVATVSVVSYSSEPSELCLVQHANISFEVLQHIQKRALNGDAGGSPQITSSPQ